MSDFKINKYLRKPNRRVSRTVTSDTTLQNGDSGGVVIIDSSSSDVEITIPSDASESFADGTVIWLYRDGANFAILRGESGVTLNPNEGFIQSDKTEIYIRKQAANEWVIGDLGGYQTSIVATGGTVSDITVNGVDYRVHEFTTVGTSTFNVEFGGEVEYLVVAGGGGGGGGNGGAGGGAGGLLTGTTTVNNQLYNITVGAGGDRQASGSDSQGFGLTAVAGGRGADQAGEAAADGGSGGGASGSFGGGNLIGTAGQGTPGQGNNGGRGWAESFKDAGGGGGGAGSPGENGFTNEGGLGGIGLENFITGISVFYAGGGGGGSFSGDVNLQSGGLGGGGRGGSANNLVSSIPGTPNTGGGGGGGGNHPYTEPNAGAAGGSGIVIIRYRI